MNLTTNLLFAALTTAFGFAAGYEWQVKNITKLELEYEQQQSSNARATFQKLERDSSRVSAAVVNAGQRVRAIADDRGNAGNAAGGLRDTTAGVVRAIADNPAACPATAATLEVVFGECIGRYIEVAARADGHAIDTLMLQEAESK